jgi:hypothetical protein
MKSLGKLLQIGALVTLPVACLLELQGGLEGGLGRSSGLATMLIMMLFGIVAFVLGRFLEGYATK